MLEASARQSPNSSGDMAFDWLDAVTPFLYAAMTSEGQHSYLYIPLKIYVLEENAIWFVYFDGVEEAGGTEVRNSRLEFCTGPFCKAASDCFF